MDNEIEAEMKVDITKEANIKGISIQKQLKQLYEKGNPIVGILGEEYESLTIIFSMRHQK